MSVQASQTNHQLYQARQILDLLDPGSHRDSQDPLIKPLSDACVFSLYRAYWFYLQELAMHHGYSKEFDSFRELYDDVAVKSDALEEINQLFHDNMTWLSQLLTEYRSLFLGASAVKAAKSANQIVTKSEGSDFQRFKNWLNELEQFIEKQRLTAEEW